MPLPFVLVGAAVALAGVGAKKGYDGYQDKSEANDILKRSKSRYESASAQLEKDDKLTHEKLENLGNLQLSIGQDLNKFQTIADDLISKLNSATKGNRNIQIDVPKYQRQRIEKLSMSSVDYASKLAGGAVGGAAAAYAVYGGVMALGAASTGTSIAALSGAAAYNATMAAIGGGSLAAGGLGMAGGAAILGGVVAAPVLAVAGWAFASHAEEALSKAWEIRREVDAFIENADVSRKYLKETREYVEKVINSLAYIRSVFTDYLDDLVLVERMMSRGRTDILEKEEYIIQMVENGYAVAAILTDIIMTPLFKVKQDNGKPLLNKEGAPEFEVDENGVKELNKDAIVHVVGRANSDVEKYKIAS